MDFQRRVVELLHVPVLDSVVGHSNQPEHPEKRGHSQHHPRGGRYRGKAFAGRVKRVFNFDLAVVDFLFPKSINKYIVIGKIELNSITKLTQRARDS